MTDHWTIEPLCRDDASAMLEIFNHYVEHGFAAYVEKPAAIDLMLRLLDEASDLAAIGARDTQGRLVGFSLLRPYAPREAFPKTAQVTTFIGPNWTGHGLGTAMLERLVGEAHKLGLTSLLAHVSSQNPGSLAFHGRQGFTECGRLRGIGSKQGASFDVVWLQRMLSTVVKKAKEDQAWISP